MNEQKGFDLSMEKDFYKTMQSVDTLKIYERLKKAKASEALSKEVAEIFREIVEDRVSTKTDLKETELKLENNIKNTGVKLENDIKNTSLKLENDLKQAELRLSSEIEKVKGEIEKGKASTIKWVAGLLLAQTGLISALVKLL